MFHVEQLPLNIKSEGSLAKKKELGQGLQDLLSGVIGINDKLDIRSMEISKIVPNKSQPRDYFDPDDMQQLVESVKDNGVLQPIIVRPVNNGHEIVAGERRWRAANQLGLKEVPVVVKALKKEKAMEIALVENLQRADLNPMEKAQAYQNLIKKYGLTQEKVAQKLRVDRSSVANVVRLLELPGEVQSCVSRGTISMGHARALLGAESASEMEKVCRRVQKEGLSVRQVEAIISQMKKTSQAVAKPAKSINENNSTILDIEDRLRKALKTKVSLKEKKGKGKLVVEFYNNSQLEHILNVLGVSLSTNV